MSLPSFAAAPRPYFEADGITLYNADALVILRALPNASIDVLLTDPPYCSGGFTETQKATATSQGVLENDDRSTTELRWFPADNMTTGGLVWLLRAVLTESRRLMRPNRAALVFTDWRMVPHLAPALESSGLRYRNMLVWDKGSAGLGVGFKPAHEIVLEYANGTTEYQVRDGSNVLRSPRVNFRRRVHPTQKPLPLIHELLRVTTPHGGVVLDPFAGSGSVLLAARERGLSAIGIEIDERNCEIAARRLVGGAEIARA